MPDKAQPLFIFVISPREDEVLHGQISQEPCCLRDRQDVKDAALRPQPDKVTDHGDHLDLMIPGAGSHSLVMIPGLVQVCSG
jgi:hypothetical protein